MLSKPLLAILSLFIATITAQAPPHAGAPSISGPINELTPAIGPSSIGSSEDNSAKFDISSKSNGNPLANGISNGDTTSAADSLLNNVKIGEGAGVLNGGLNGNSLLNGNEIDPNVGTVGSGNDGNAIDVNERRPVGHRVSRPEGGKGHFFKA